MPVCYAPPVEAGPRNNVGEFLEPPILTTPQRSNPWSLFGGIEAEGARKSKLYQNRPTIILLFIKVGYRPRVITISKIVHLYRLLSIIGVCSIVTMLSKQQFTHLIRLWKVNKLTER